MKHVQINLRRKTQQGVVLFIALIALLVMSLAAVVLVRSVDTSTLIAGNLAFKQAATASADAGVAAAVPWMIAKQGAEPAASKDPWVHLANTFNNDSPTTGYYSSIATPANLTDAATWADTTSRPGTGHYFDADGKDSSTGNTVRYIIQRMCRTANQLLTVSNCLLSDDTEPNGSRRGRLSHEAGLGSGATTGSPIYRITARVTGPKNSVSYIQAYAY
jgi:type IV pilus assembly protein PilX